MPETTAVKDAAAGEMTVRLMGWVLKAGTYCTVSVAAPLVNDPTLLLTTQRNCAPLSEEDVNGVVYDAAVAPEMLTQLTDKRCHW